MPMAWVVACSCIIVLQLLNPARLHKILQQIFRLVALAFNSVRPQ